MISNKSRGILWFKNACRMLKQRRDMGFRSDIGYSYHKGLPQKYLKHKKKRISKSKETTLRLKSSTVLRQRARAHIYITIA